MLTPELQKLKECLEGTEKDVCRDKLLKELVELDRKGINAFTESLSTSSRVCPTCGKDL